MACTSRYQHRSFTRGARACAFVLVTAGTALGGCASTAPQGADLRGVSAAIRAAKAEGAREDLAAARYLALAEREAADAEARLRAGDTAGARGMLMRARADAALSQTLAREIRARAAAQRAVDEASALEEDPR